MSAKDETIPTGSERMNEVFAWWAIPGATGNGQFGGQMKRFQAFTSDLQKVYGDAYSSQMGALLAANERVARSFQELFRCRQPQDVIAAESNVLTTIMEEASLQARSWIALTQRVQDCCAAMAREAVDDIPKQATAGTDAKPPGKAA